jgi:hypothetical protein
MATKEIQPQDEIVGDLGGVHPHLSQCILQDKKDVP